MIKEVWKPIKNYEGLYAISNLGRVKSLQRYRLDRGFLKTIRERILKHGLAKNGYYLVSLCKNGNQKNGHIHQLVAKAFLLKKPGTYQVNHKDGIKTNNNVNNLEWVTASYNRIHAYNNGLQKRLFKKIVQLDMNGNKIKEWNSCKEAYLFLGVKQSTLSQALVKKYKCKGYNFNYL